MEKRILAVLIAALAGGAYAQTYQNSNTAPAQKATAPQPAGARADITGRRRRRIAGARSRARCLRRGRAVRRTPGVCIAVYVTLCVRSADPRRD